MADITTIARPYAKGIFEHALEANNLAAWSQYLFILEQVVLNSEAKRFIANPGASLEQQIELLQAIIEANKISNPAVNNLICLLATNKRLVLLPAIKALYEALKAEHEKTIIVNVLSFSNLSNEQEHQLTESLARRLKRKVSLRVSIDPLLLGGLVLRADDLVIDGSILGKLNKLHTSLAA